MSTLSNPTVTQLPGLGTTLSLATAGILGRVSIDGPDLKMGGAETTNLDSLVKTMRPTLLDPGELSMQIWFDPNSTSHQTLLSTFLAKTIGAWVLTFADGHTTNANCAFNGYISGFKVGGIEAEGNVTADLTIQVTSQPVFTAGTAP